MDCWSVHKRLPGTIVPFNCERFHPKQPRFWNLLEMDRLLQKFASLPGQAAIAGVAIAEAVTPEEALQLQPVAA